MVKRTVPDRDVPPAVGPRVPLVVAARTTVDPELTGKARRRAEDLAAARVRPKDLKALRRRLEKVAAEAAELGLALHVDRDALETLATPAPEPVAGDTVAQPAVTAPTTRTATARTPAARTTTARTPAARTATPRTPAARTPAARNPAARTPARPGTDAAPAPATTRRRPSPRGTRGA